MKKTISLTFIFALLLFASEAQNIRHDQLQVPNAETSDSLIFYMHDAEGYWRLGKGILDTSMIKYIEAYATIERLNDSVVVLRGEIPTLLTELDSTGFTVDTSQVRDLQTFVANNSGSASISGTEGYLPKFGASGLTESVVFEDAIGNVGIGTTDPLTKLHVVTSESNDNMLLETTDAIRGRIGFDLKTNYGANAGDYFRFNFRGDFSDIVQTVYDSSTDTYHPFTKFNYSTDLLTLGNLSGYTYIQSERTGIGTTTPSEKLEVNGNIKGDTIKTIGIEASGDVVFDLASPEKFKINYGGSTIVESNAVFNSLVFHSAPWLLDRGQGTHPNQFPTIGQMMDSIATVGGAVNSVNAGYLVDVSNTTGSVTVNVDLSEATSDNTFTSTDQLVYLSGTAAKKGTVSGLQTYMQSNLDFGSGGSGGVSSITAGTGLTGTSTTGNVTLNLNAATSSTIGGVKFGTYANIGGYNYNSSGDFWMDDSKLYTATPVSSDIIGFYNVSSGFQKKTTIADILALGGGGSMVYPGAGIPVSTGSAWGTSITNNSANWNTAYTDRNKWDGEATGLNATNGRTNLGLGTMATKGFWSGTQAQYNALGSYSSTTIYFIED